MLFAVMIRIHNAYKPHTLGAAFEHFSFQCALNMYHVMHVYVIVISFVMHM